MVDQIQQLTQKYADRQLRAFVVYEGGPELKASLEQMTQKRQITIPVTYLPEGKNSEALKEYHVDPAAKNTIVTYRHKTVTANFVDVDGATFPKVAEAAAAMLK